MTDDRPNILLILADDMGYSDLGCYGGEIPTPCLDTLARRGVRMTQFYNTARCSPSRASLLTGRHPHETGVGVLTGDQTAKGGYRGDLSVEIPTAAEWFKRAGYATCLSGKWHLSKDRNTVGSSFPTRRGFDEFYGILGGQDDYFHPRDLWHQETQVEPPSDGFYLTEALAEHASGWIADRASEDSPFFHYLSFTAPHGPLQAKEDSVVAFEDEYLAGWDELRVRRYERMREEGVIADDVALSDRDPLMPAWADEEHQSWQARRMAVYAAQLVSMDAAIAQVLKTLERTGQRENTMIIFLSDNGACAERVPTSSAEAPGFFSRLPKETLDGRPMRIGDDPSVWPGADDSFAGYGRSWANLSNTPFRFYKRWVHEGGIATPLIVDWPAGDLRRGALDDKPHQLTDLLPTLCEAAGLPAPDGAAGKTMLTEWRTGVGSSRHTLFWEHLGNAAVRRGRHKLVREAGRPWELYDIVADRCELNDLAANDSVLVAELEAEWQSWANSVGVIPWEDLARSLPAFETSGELERASRRTSSGGR